MLEAIVLAAFLGIAAQVLAERLRLPAILPLLVFGMLAGPYGFGWFSPDRLGQGLEVLVHIAVAVILFEGALSLNLQQLTRVGGSVRNLLTIGAAVTTLGAAFLAWSLVGLAWPVALLFGAIVMVTGPTVIAPLLRHMVAPRRVKVVLTSEGLIVDAIGATVAYLILQWVERAGLPLHETGASVLRITAVGAVVGFAVGAFARYMTRGRWVGTEVRNLAILALLLLGYLIAEREAPQSGILASLVMGVTMAAGNVPDIARIKRFKGQLTIFLISFVFVLLAAQLDVRAMVAMGGRGLLVVAGLVLVVRPAAVFLSVPGRQLGWRERAALAMLAPRGIVAAAVASLSAISLRRVDPALASSLEGLVYLVILATGAWATLMAVVVPRALGYLDDPTRRRVVLVGANRLSEVIGDLLRRTGRSLVVVDAVAWRLDRFRDRGDTVVVGDAREAVTYEEAGLERDSVLVAASTNDELNLLVAELGHGEFGVEHPVVALNQPPDELGSRSRAWLDLLGGRGFEVAGWIRRLESGQGRLLEVELGDDEPLTAVRDAQRRWPTDILTLCGWKGSEVSFEVAGDKLPALDAVTLLVTEGKPLEFLQKHVAPTERQEAPATGDEASASVPSPAPADRDSLEGEPIPAPRIP